MATKFNENEINPFSRFFEEFSFEYNGQKNIGLDDDGERVLGVEITPPIHTPPNGLGLPTMNQTVYVAFVDEVVAEGLLGAISSNFKYDQAFLQHFTPTEIEADTAENKNNLFKNSHSYYNLKIPSYEQASEEYQESSLPCFLFGIYNYLYNSPYGKRIISNNDPTQTYETVVNPFPQSFTNASFIESYPSDQLGAVQRYVFDNHGTYDYYNNYYSVFQQNLMMDDEFTEQSKNIYCTMPTSVIKVLSKKGTYHTPYYNYIKINNHGHSGLPEILNVLKKYQLSDLIMRRISKTEPEGTIGDAIIFNMQSILNVEEIEQNQSDYTYLNNNGVSVFNDTLAAAGGFQSPNNLDISEMFNNIEDFYDACAGVIMHNFLDLRDMVYKEGNCYNELIGYRIIKTRAGRNTPVQEFYFALDEPRSFAFVDTQIRHSTQYTYTFYPLYVSISFSIKLLGTSSGGNEAKLDFGITPHIKLIHLNIGQFVTTVVEPPPNKPIVKFCNYNNENNKIKIRIDDRTGRDISSRSRLPLQAISNSDLEYRNNVAEYCKSQYPYYSSISSFGVFEIYRINTKPTSILDFDGNLVEIVENDVFDEFGRKRIKNASTVHYLEHGKKYYYLIRAMTHRGNYSNPSPVYEVEKIKDADNSILNIKAIKMTPPDLTSYSTSFRKFLKISIPEYHLVARAKDGDIDVNTAFGNNLKLFLGEDDLPDNLWNYNSLSGSHIKLRLESKSTGKKIDFNLIFNYNQPENN